MEHYSITGVESTRKRKSTAFRSRPFALLRGITLMDTEAEHSRRTITYADSTTTPCISDGY